MPHRKNLNGLPHNLIKSFFGTERYYKFGYMADWLFNAANKLQLKEATLDILNHSIQPTDLNLYPLTTNLKDLSLIIDKELKSNGFPPDFISEAKIRIEFSNSSARNKTLYCFPTLKDKEGREYGPKRIIEYAFEDMFDPFDLKNIYPDKPSFIDKIKSIFS